jgi:hypothetical protein
VRGQHTLEVMEWLGYDRATIHDYLTMGIIGTS